MQASRRDLLVVVLLVVVVWGLSAWLDLGERLSNWAGSRELYQADELPGAVVALLLGLVWYAWRRVEEVEAQMQAVARADEQLRATLAANRRLAAAHLALQEAERRDLARELHDELGQHLNLIKLEAVAIRNASAPESDVEGRSGRGGNAAGAVAMIQAVDHVQRVVREMLGRLRPVALDELGLQAALEHLVSGWRSRHPVPALELSVKGNLDPHGEPVHMAVYRIVQEGLTNVLRHARARRVIIGIDATSAGLRLTVADDGIGVEPGRQTDGLGLVGMRERVEALGGQIEVDTAPGLGCRIMVWLPCPPVAARAGAA